MADSDTKVNPDNNNPIHSRTERHCPAASGQGFLRQVVSVYAIGALFLALAAVVWLGGDVLLLLFACILLALLLYMASVKVQRWLPVSRGIALAIVVAAGCARERAEQPFPLQENVNCVGLEFLIWNWPSARPSALTWISPST